MKLSLLSVCPAIALLTACGGSGSQVGASFADMSDQLESDAALIEDLGGTPKSSAIANGSGTYSGVAGYILTIDGDESRLTSNMEMTVAFSGNNVSGEMTNFVTEDEDVVGGSLSLSNGSIDSSGSEVLISADMGGNLTGPEGEDVSVDGAVLAGYGGANAQYIGVLMGGDFDVDDAEGSFEGVGILAR